MTLMIVPANPLRIDLSLTDRRSRDHQLTQAVNQLIPAALENRRGILITQHTTASYTLEVDPGVPCGTIHEKREEA